MKVDGVFRQPFRSKTPSDLTAQNSADYTVGVVDRQRGFDLFPTLQGRFGEVEEYLVIQRFLEPMVLRGLAVTTNLRANLRLVEDSRAIQALVSPVAGGPSGVELVRWPNRFLELTEAGVR